MSDNSKDPLVYLIAGEASGDLLASRLMAALKDKTGGKVAFAGVGGATMKEQGFETLFDNSELAVMGLIEVLPRIPKIMRLIGQVVNDIKAKQPDIVITVDSWSFSDNIHRRLRGVNIPHIHYVAPQVWAWKAGRAAKMASKIDGLLTLLPFENKYFTKYGIDTVCVGHPVVEGFISTTVHNDFKKQHNIPQSAKILCVLPGSRHNEIRYLLPIFAKTVRLMQDKYPDLHIVIPTVAAVAKDVEKAVSSWQNTIVLPDIKDKTSAFAISDLALAASGTVSLELAMAGVPHIIGYKLSPITAYFAKKILKVKFVNLINIIADKPIIPECLQEHCTPLILFQNLQTLLEDKVMASEQRLKAKEVLSQIGYGSKQTPSAKAADKVLDIIAKHRAP